MNERMAIMVKQMTVLEGLVGVRRSISTLSPGHYVCKPGDRRLFFLTEHADNPILCPVLDDGRVQIPTSEFPCISDELYAFNFKDIPGIKLHDGRPVMTNEKLV